MYFNTINKPTLIEPGAKYFFDRMLFQCHKYREEWNNTIFNIFLFLLFVSIVTVFLIYCYKGKMSPEERRKKELKEYQIMMANIQQFKLNQLKKSQDLLTGLPVWESDYNNMILHS